MSARRFAWSLVAVSALLAIPTAVLIIVQIGGFTPGDTFVQGGAGGPAFVIASLAYAIVGAFVVSRVPGNSVGWIFCLMGFLVGVGSFAYQYADRALYGDPGSLPGADAAAWLQNLGLPPAFGLLALVLLLFPHGRLPSHGAIRAGELEIDPSSREVRLRGERVVLSQKEFSLLRALAMEPTRIEQPVGRRDQDRVAIGSFWPSGVTPCAVVADCPAPSRSSSSRVAEIPNISTDRGTAAPGQHLTLSWHRAVPVPSLLMTAEVPGMTQEMVDGMTGQLEEQQKAQPGFVVHANGPIDGGWGVTEVWEAQENWDSWYEGTIKPTLPEGMEPRITTRELHYVMQP